MTEQKEEPKNVAVDLECDDEFKEFGNGVRDAASGLSPPSRVSLNALAGPRAPRCP